MAQSLILLDRDGVVNRMVVDPEHGTIDSPLHPAQVELLPGVAEALARLTNAGHALAIVSNQPAAAKGKTTRANLEAVHQAVLAMATEAGGAIVSSHICFHRAEDDCDCRKPRTGLLREALAQHPEYAPRLTWMVGDGLTDIQAGAALGLSTAFLGPLKCEICKVFSDKQLTPSFRGRDLVEFTKFLLAGAPILYFE